MSKLNTEHSKVLADIINAIDLLLPAQHSALLKDFLFDTRHKLLTIQSDSGCEPIKVVLSPRQQFDERLHCPDEIDFYTDAPETLRRDPQKFAAALRIFADHMASGDYSGMVEPPPRNPMNTPICHACPFEWDEPHEVPPLHD